jgi:tRNA dimethylallyltransferase
MDHHGIPARRTAGAHRCASRNAFERGLIDEVRRVRDYVGDERLNELGLEYRIVGEYLRGERTEASLLPTLSAKLWQYARRQRAWIRKLQKENPVTQA